ncbi:MAG: hypothetical protein V3V01_17205 [Acidimicrobiales bacterium]
MDHQQARQALGLDSEASLADARRSYLELVRQNHPDIAGADGAETTVRLNQAIALLEREPGPVPTGPIAEPEMRLVDDALLIEAPSDELYSRLAAALDVVGNLTYSDPSCGYLEALVSLGASTPSQLVVSLAARGPHTEAFFALESMGVETPPDLADVVRAIAEVL